MVIWNVHLMIPLAYYCRDPEIQVTETCIGKLIQEAKASIWTVPSARVPTESPFKCMKMYETLVFGTLDHGATAHDMRVWSNIMYITFTVPTRSTYAKINARSWNSKNVRRWRAKSPFSSIARRLFRQQHVAKFVLKCPSFFGRSWQSRSRCTRRCRCSKTTAWSLKFQHSLGQKSWVNLSS